MHATRLAHLRLPPRIELRRIRGLRDRMSSADRETFPERQIEYEVRMLVQQVSLLERLDTASSGPAPTLREARRVAERQGASESARAIAQAGSATGQRLAAQRGAAQYSQPPRSSSSLEVGRPAHHRPRREEPRDGSDLSRCFAPRPAAEQVSSLDPGCCSGEPWRESRQPPPRGTPSAPPAPSGRRHRPDSTSPRARWRRTSPPPRSLRRRPRSRSLGYRP